ncbi:MAG: glycosyltransferase family 2 protein [Candidatus Altiarchaeota archaeon]
MNTMLLPEISILMAIRYGVIFFGTFTTVVFLLIFLEERERIISSEKRKAPQGDNLPNITILIPAFNEEDCISSTLDSLLSLTYPKKKLKIFVVDDGSKDKTAEIVKSYKEKGIELIGKENTGKAASINFGFENVKDDFVLVVDADTYLTEDALERMYSYLTDDTIAASVPTIQILKPRNLLEQVQMVEYTFGNFLRRIFTTIGSFALVPACVLLRSDVLRKVGGFDESALTEDFELGLRLKHEHFNIAHATEVIAKTRAPNTFKAIERQRMRWYYGGYENLLKYRDFLFNKKYEDFGVFTFSMTFISIAATVFLFLYVLLTVSFQIYNNVLILYFGGPTLYISTWLTPPTFQTPLNPLAYLLLFCMITSIIVFSLAKRYTHLHHYTLGFVAYVTLYWFIFSFFRVKALILFLLHRRPGWKRDIPPV